MQIALLDFWSQTRQTRWHRRYLPAKRSCCPVYTGEPPAISYVYTSRNELGSPAVSCSLGINQKKKRKSSKTLYTLCVSLSSHVASYSPFYYSERFLKLRSPVLTKNENKVCLSVCLSLSLSFSLSGLFFNFYFRERTLLK